MIRLSTAGESHGPRLIAIVEGLPAGLPLSAAAIRADLARRQIPLGAGGRMSIETDVAAIEGGVMAGVATGAPVALSIENRDHAAWAGRSVPALAVPRPGHADLAAAVKYGYGDCRFALERASARETAARTAAGACCRALLAEFGIEVSSRIVEIGGVPGDASSPAVAEAIARARRDGETLGGIIEVRACGVPPGLGSHVSASRRLDAALAAAVVSVQSVKGVEFGDGFALAAMPGTKAQDPIVPGPDGLLHRPTSRCGGIEGGISNGSPIVLRAALKPIPTTLSPQDSADLSSGAPAKTRYERSDTCAVPRAAVVLEAAVALVLADALSEKLGGDSLAEMKRRFAALPRLEAKNPAFSGAAVVFWPR